MKALLLTTLMMTAGAGHALTLTDDFKIYCGGKVQITASEPFYVAEHCGSGTPLHPYYQCYRANPIPASGGFKIHAKVTELGAGCATLDDKYKTPLYHKEFNSVFYVKTPSLAAAVKAMHVMNGKTVNFKVSQSFGYTFGPALPLYPELMDETIYLQGENSLGSFGYTLPVDTKEAYGISGIEDKTDTEKLAIVQKILDFNVQRQKEGHFPNYGVVAFDEVIASLVPVEPANQKVFLGKVLEAMDFAAGQKYPDALFFEFNVGGSSGVTLAKVIVDLQGLMSSEELVDVLTQYPGLLYTLTIGTMKLSAAQVEVMLQNHLAAIQASTKYDKMLGINHHILQDVAGTYKFFTVFQSQPELMTPAVQALFEQIKSILYKP